MIVGNDTVIVLAMTLSLLVMTLLMLSLLAMTLSVDNDDILTISPFMRVTLFRVAMLFALMPNVDPVIMDCFTIRLFFC